MAIEPALRPATSDDRQFVNSLLTHYNLPTEDLAEVINCLLICELDSQRIGVGGLEQHGQVGLIRSVAIDETYQQKEYGTTLVRELLGRAHDAELEAVYLLTTTAPDFFESIGFHRVSRDAVPQEIRDTAEFTDLCPSTAVCMEYCLDG